MSCMRLFKQRKHLQIRDFHGHKERRKFAQKHTQDIVIISAKLSETGSPCDPVPRKYCESSESLNQSGAASGWRGDSSSFLQSTICVGTGASRNLEDS